MPVRPRSVSSSRGRRSVKASSRVHRGWLAFFGLWIVLLTGVFSRFTGTPGVFQWWKLKRLEDTKNAELSRLEIEVESLERTANLIDHSPRVLEREIRRTLGYVGPDELILDIKDRD